MAETTVALRKPTPREMIAVALQAQIPAIIWGPPGGGKTSAVRAIAQQLDLHQETIISSLRDPTDFGGLPYVHDGVVKLATPDWAKRLCDVGLNSDRELAGIAFFDEITSTPPAVQAALLRVVFERVVGSTQLPPNIAVLAAANPPDQAAGGWDLALPLANRFMHIQWENEPLAWAENFRDNFQRVSDTPLSAPPKGQDQLVSMFRDQIASFITGRPELVCVIPKDAAQRAFPTPRTWDMLAKLLAAADSLLLEAAPFAAAAVGTAAGLEFLAFNATRRFSLDAVSAMQGDNAYIQSLPKATIDSVQAFLRAVLAHTLASKDQKTAGIRAWSILYQTWEAKQQAIDVVYPTAVKLATALPIRISDLFMSAESNKDLFAKNIREALRTHAGLDLS